MPIALLRSGLRIHYQQVGEGPDVVMLHGMTGNLAIWHLRIVPLLRSRFRITTYDLRGHGHSDVPPTGYSTDDMATDLADLLDALEIPRARLVGHSVGADIALYFALRYPERSSMVVAIEAALPALRDERTEAQVVEVLERAGIPVPLDRRSDLRYLLHQFAWVPKLWGPLRGLPRNGGSLIRLLDATTVIDDYQHVGSLSLDRICEIQPPVVLIYSESSGFLNAYNYLRDRLPHSKSIMMPGSEWGHFGPLEQPELVAKNIVDAVSESLERESSEQGLSGPGASDGAGARKSLEQTTRG